MVDIDRVVNSDYWISIRIDLVYKIDREGIDFSLKEVEMVITDGDIDWLDEDHISIL